MSYDPVCDIALVRLRPSAPCARTQVNDGRYLLGHDAEGELVSVGIAEPSRRGIGMSALPEHDQARAAIIALARQHGFALTE